MESPKPSEPAARCSNCGTGLTAETTGGLCPRCLLEMNLASRTMPGGEPSPQVPPPSPEEIADRFPQFEIVECLGRGGMGIVYKARQKSLDRLVAIKVLADGRHDEAEFAARFSREARTLAKMSHPNIVTVFDHGETNGLFYIVMEFVDGVNLRDLLCEGKIEPEQALAIVPPICEALEYAHDKGVVHRDIKPENLLLDRDGRVKIADFGIASLVGASGEKSGTPPYMAPEQEMGVVDRRADIYALGAVLYEMLTGERPDKDLVAPSKRVEIDVRLDEIVLRALEKEPARRYQTAGEFRTVVQTMVASEGKAPAQADAIRGLDARWQTAKVVVIIMAVFWTVFTAIRHVLREKSALDTMLLEGAVLVGMGIAFLGARYLFRIHRRQVERRPQERVTETEAGSQEPAARRVTSEIERRFPVASMVGRIRRLTERYGQLGLIVTALGALTILGAIANFNFMFGIEKSSMVLAGALLAAAGVVAAVLEQKPAVGSSKPEVGKQKAEDKVHFSRPAIVGACWAPLFFIALVPMFTVNRVSAGQSHGPEWWQYLLMFTLLPLGLAAPFGTTILGGVALTQIRRSVGRIHGLGLALFDVLLFPLLALNALIGGFWVLLSRAFASSSGGYVQPNLVSVLLATLVTAIIIDIMIVRWAWRAANKPVGKDGPGDGTPQTTALRKSRMKFAAIIGVLIAAMTALFFWAQQPRMVDERTIAADSPDEMFSAMGQTYHAMRVFDSDRTFYRFQVQGRAGAVFESWEVPVPYNKLATSYVLLPRDEILFGKHGEIVWSDDGKRVSFRVNGTEISAYNTEDGGHSFQGGFLPQREVTLPAPARTGTSFLDLDTGEIVVPSVTAVLNWHLGESQRIQMHPKICEWMRSTAVDLRMRAGISGLTLLDGVSITMAEFADPNADPRAFDTLSAAQVADSVAAVEQSFADAPRSEPRLFGLESNRVHAVKTREGAIALVEILEESKLGPTRLRYKLVKPDTAAQAAYVGEWEWHEGSGSDDFCILVLKDDGTAVVMEDGEDGVAGTWTLADDGITMTVGDDTIASFLDPDGHLVLGKNQGAGRFTRKVTGRAVEQAACERVARDFIGALMRADLDGMKALLAPMSPLPQLVDLDQWVAEAPGEIRKAYLGDVSRLTTFTEWLNEDDWAGARTAAEPDNPGRGLHLVLQRTEAGWRVMCFDTAKWDVPLRNYLVEAQRYAGVQPWTGGGNGAGSDPKEAARAYMEAVRRRDYHRAAGLTGSPLERKEFDILATLMSTLYGKDSDRMTEFTESHLDDPYAVVRIASPPAKLDIRPSLILRRSENTWEVLGGPFPAAAGTSSAEELERVRADFQEPDDERIEPRLREVLPTLNGEALPPNIDVGRAKAVAEQPVSRKTRPADADDNARVQARQLEDLSTMKEYATALAIYQLDAGSIPPNLESLVLRKYLQEIPVVRNHATGNMEKPLYHGGPGLRVETVDVSKTIVLAAPSADPTGKRIVGFLDSHVAVIDEADYQEQLKAQQKPPME